ncbi:MAG: chemotaxis protein CheW [Gammaproteobacteria bacterium]|nr:chemotaxis protein CheW [Gammaproteobacteria bacterium]
MSDDAELAASNNEISRWVTFEMDKESYGISVSQVHEVLRFTEIAPVPGAPSFIIGIINLRGNVVTVIDTRSRFGLAPKEVSDSSRIIINEIEGQQVGILVDSVAEVVDIYSSDIEPAPNVGNEDTSRYIQGVTSLDGDLLIIIDLSKLLSENELTDLSLF